MTIVYKIWDCPPFSVKSQLFYLPGVASEGGFTVGGAKIATREPGGFAMLEIVPAFRDETGNPFYSWLMSKTNGEILRLRLAPTPQIATGQMLRGLDPLPHNTTHDFANIGGIRGNIKLRFASVALEGTTTVTINMAAIGRILKPGHLIGHAYDCYLIDEILYSTSNVATLTIKGAFKRDIAVNDEALLLPYFTGQIANGGELRAAYDAANNGGLELGKILLSECII
jgi:hypothetical protein